MRNDSTWRALCALAAVGALAAARPSLACVAEGRTLDVGFYHDFIPVSYSAEKDGSGGAGEHRGYEADLLSALEAMGGLPLARRPVDGPWRPFWLWAATPGWDLMGGGITIRADRTRDADGNAVIAFTAGHIAFVQTLLVRAGDARRLASYDGLGPGDRVGLVPGTTGEERLLQLTGLAGPDGVLRRGVRVHTPAGIVEADGGGDYVVTAAGASANVAGRSRLEPPAGAAMPQVVYFAEEADQLGALRAGTVDAVSRGLIGNADAAAESGGALVVAARDSRVEYGGFALSVADSALRACLDERIAWLTDSLAIGYEEWRADSGVFLRRAEAWTARAEARADRPERVHRAVLPEVARALSDIAAGAVARRVEDAFSGAPAPRPSAAAAALANALQAAARKPEGGAGGAARLFAGPGFAMALDGGAAGAGAATVWGGGEYRRLSGGGGGAPGWDGGLANARLGADARPRPGLLAGAMLSFSEGSFDYAGRAYDARMTSAHPYAGWSPADGTVLWATAGYGRGEAAISDDGRAGALTAELAMTTLAAGGERRIFAAAAAGGGAAALSLTGDLTAARMESAAAGAALPAFTTNVRRVRAALAARFERAAPSGGQFAPSLEAGLRHDGGDGATGAGLELAGGLLYAAPASGLALEARAWWLAAHRSDRSEWGVSGALRLAPGPGGRGLSLRFAPALGAAPRAGNLWERGATGGGALGGGARLDAEFGYGLAAFGGLLTPWSALRLAGGGRGARMGGRLAFGPAFVLGLEAGRHADRGGEVALRGAARF